MAGCSSNPSPCGDLQLQISGVKLELIATSRGRMGSGPSLKRTVDCTKGIYVISSSRLCYLKLEQHGKSQKRWKNWRSSRTYFQESTISLLAAIDKYCSWIFVFIPKHLFWLHQSSTGKKHPKSSKNKPHAANRTVLLFWLVVAIIKPLTTPLKAHESTENIKVWSMLNISKET